MSILTSATVSNGQNAAAAQYNAVRKDVLLAGGDYNDSTGSANAYLVTIDAAITAYVTGMTVKFKANFTNTGASVVTVNAIAGGAKAIKHADGTDLIINDILSGSVCEAVYDGTNFQLVSSRMNEGKFVALSGEVIDGTTTPVPIYIEDGILVEEKYISQEVINTSVSLYGVNWYAQSFTANVTTITKITLLAQKNSTPSGDFTMSIYATDGAGKPTGAALSSVTVNIAGFSGALVDIVLSSPLAVTLGAKYIMVCKFPTGTNTYKLLWNTANSDLYAGGTSFSSTDSGVTWTDRNADFGFRVWGYFTGTMGRAYMSQSGAPYVRARFNGFAISSGNAGDPIAITLPFEICSGFSGLTPGAKYYVQDTIGTIAVTKNATALYCGQAVDANRLLVSRERVKGDFISVGSVNGGGTTTVSGTVTQDGFLLLNASTVTAIVTLSLTSGGITITPRVSTSDGVFALIFPVSKGDTWTISCSSGSNNGGTLYFQPNI